MYIYPFQLTETDTDKEKVLRNKTPSGQVPHPPVCRDYLLALQIWLGHISEALCILGPSRQNYQIYKDQYSYTVRPPLDVVNIALTF